MSRASRLAVLGGSFDRLHIGHRALLDAAFEAADRVGIGITTAEFLRAHPKPLGRAIQPFDVRRRAVDRYLAARYPRSRWWLAKLSDPWGRSLAPEVDVLVASAETARAARTVNQIRRRRGVSPVRLILVPLVRGADLLPVSARRIRRGLIDRRGRRVRPLSIALSGGSPRDRREVRRALRELFHALPLRINAAGSAAPRRSGRADPRQRARARAIQSARRAEYGIGLEVRASATAIPKPVGCLAVADADGLVGEARTAETGGWEAALRSVLPGVRSTSRA